MRANGSLAVTTRTAGADLSWEPSTVVRIDHIENVERQIYRVHRADGRSAEVPEGSLRDVQPEDHEGVWAFQGDPSDITEQEQETAARVALCERAASVLRSRAPFAAGPDVVQVIVLAAYMESGLTWEMTERVRESLQAVLEQLQFPVRTAPMSEAEERQQKDEQLLSEIDSQPQEFIDKTVISAGQLKAGDGTEFWKVLEREGETRDGVLLRIVLTDPGDDENPFSTLHVLKSTPVDVISRIVT